MSLPTEPLPGVDDAVFGQLMGRSDLAWRCDGMGNRVMVGQRPPKATCWSCGEPIMWVVTEQGKRMPIDVEPSEHGTVALRDQTPGVARVVSRNGRHPGQKLYVSHFVTCRFADQHRKAAGRKTPAMPQEGLFSAPHIPDDSPARSGS